MTFANVMKPDPDRSTPTTDFRNARDDVVEKS